MQTRTINIELSEKNQALLSSRTYSQVYTEMKNPALPPTLSRDLSIIYEALTLNPLPETGFTFLIRATSEGTFKRVYSPCIYKKDGGLVVRWGEEVLPISMVDGKLTASGDAKVTFKNFKVLGKYDNIAISVTVRNKDCLITMPFPIRLADLKAEVSPDLFEALLEDEDYDGILSYVSELKERAEGDEERSNVFRPKDSYLIKEAQLPEGKYKVCSYWGKENAQYGTRYYMTVKVDQPFNGIARVKEEEEWLDKEVEVSEWAIVNANSSSKRILSANPIITLDQPASLEVLSHGVTKQGHKFCKSTLSPVAFEEDESSVSLNF